MCQIDIVQLLSIVIFGVIKKAGMISMICWYYAN